MRWKLLLLLSFCTIQFAFAQNTTTYFFKGTCSDCTGFGTGQLVLQNYTRGASMQNSNFVSFSYTSNLVNFSWNSSQTPFNIFGSIPANLPGPANVNLNFGGFAVTSEALAASPKALAGFVFSSSLNGSWCTGVGCSADFGTAGTWSVATTATGAPALSDTILGCLAVGMAVFGARLLRKAQA